jgi:hypothetical protein
VSWEAIAAVGELVGAIAVLITLVYLAAQIRQSSQEIAANTRVARLAARHASQEALSRFRNLISNRELAELYLEGCADYEGLAPADRLRFASVLQELLLAYDLIYQQFNEGAYESDMWDRLMPVMLATLRQPGVLVWSGRNKSLFRPAFVAAVEQGMSARQ